MRGSQHGEDLWIVANLKLPTNGFYCEVGASDGVENSNTLLFQESLGWTGILIEPDLRHLISHNRKGILLTTAISATEGKTFFHQHVNPTWSGLKRTGLPIYVQTKRLDTILKEHKVRKLDLLSIDTEGTELDVWASLGEFPKPTIVIIEYLTAELPSNEELIKTQFAADGYELVHRTIGNLVFRLKI